MIDPSLHRNWMGFKIIPPRSHPFHTRLLRGMLDRVTQIKTTNHKFYSLWLCLKGYVSQPKKTNRPCIPHNYCSYMINPSLNEKLSLRLCQTCISKIWNLNSWKIQINEHPKTFLLEYILATANANKQTHKQICRVKTEESVSWPSII